MSAPQTQQQNAQSYWDALEKQRKAEKTALTLTPAELQRVINASELDPSILRRIPAFREMEWALGQASADVMASREGSWFHENVNAQYGNYTRFNQKLGIGVDMLVKASENRLATSVRNIKGSAALVNKKRSLSPLEWGFIALILMFAGAVLFVPGNQAGFGAWLGSSYYGVPNPYILIGFFAAVYFLIVRRSKKE